MSHLIPQVNNLVLKKMEKGELNLETKEELKKVLEEYEVHIKFIEEQLEACKKDHKELREEIACLVEENNDIRKQLQARKCCELLRVESSCGCVPKTTDSEIIDNLREQLDMVMDEKLALEGLWKESLNQVQVVEDKLKEYKSGKHLTLARDKLNDVQKDYSEAIVILEARLCSLRSDNDQLTVKVQMLEKQLQQATSNISLLEEKNVSLNSSLKDTTAKKEDLKSQYLALEARFIEMDRAYELMSAKVKCAHINEYEKREACMKEKMEAAQSQRDEMQVALERCQERMAELLRTTGGDREKVKEAVAVLEEAMRARDQALEREAQCAEEVKRLRGELTSLVQEAGARVGQETAAVVKHCDSKVAMLKNQLEVTEQERLRYCTEVQQLQKECQRLQDLLDHNNRGQTSEKHEKELSRLCQELRSLEMENMQLKMENNSLQDAIDDLQEKWRRTTREKTKLKDKLVAVLHQLQCSQHELSTTAQKAEILNAHLQQTSLELAQLESEKVALEKGQIYHTENRVRATSTMELCKKFDDSYTEMNNKWKNEMNALTEKFETKIKKLKVKNKCGLGCNCKDDESRSKSTKSENCSQK